MLYDPKWETTVTPLEDWQGQLLKAADLVRKNGLAKYAQLDRRGAMCVQGAISIAKTGRPYASTSACGATIALYKYLLAQGVDPQTIAPGGCAEWNNEEERTAEQVISALEGAARA